MSSPGPLAALTLNLDDKAAYDAIVHGASFPECGDLSIATLSRATRNHMPLVAIGFSVKLPGGEIRKVQHVTTARLFLAVADAIRGKHGMP